jgi:copper chaperone CopZ
MSLGITLQVKGSDYSGDGASYPPERIVTYLQRLDGVVSVHYDPGSQRFAVDYDHKRTDILRILRQIEIAGQKAGRVYHPTDVQPT